jgi:beta-lactam-binding protein with PASTA domain
MGRNWVWFAGPAAATTSLFIAVAVFSGDGGGEASRGAVVTETSSPRATTVERTPTTKRRRTTPTRPRTSAGSPATATTRDTTTATAATTTTPRTTAAATTTPTTTTTTTRTTTTRNTTTPPKTTTTPETTTTTTTRGATGRTTTRRKPRTTAPATTTSARPTPPPRRAPAGVARVPDLYGLTPRDAILALREVGLRFRVRREPSFQPDGLVFDQKPPPNARLARGERVVLAVSAETPSAAPPPPPAPETSSAPRVVGLDYSEAAARMEALGVVANLYPVRSKRRPTFVIAQLPGPGTRLTRGTRVRLTVSVGRRAWPSQTIPNTVGLKELAAHERCRDADFLCRTVAVPTRHPRGPGRVVRQRPAAGEIKPELTQMTLFVGK